MSDDAFRFVGLQVSDEVPFDVLRHLRNLGKEFLHAAFAEDALPGIVGASQALDGMEFADGDQCDVLRQDVVQSAYFGGYIVWHRRLFAAEVGFVYVHNQGFGDGLYFVVAEDAFHAFVDVGEGGVEVFGLYEVLCRGFFLVAFFVDLDEGDFCHIVFIAGAVVEYFVDFGALHCRNGEFAGDERLRFFDDACFSLCEGERIHNVWFGDAFHRAVLLHFVVTYFTFEPCCHISGVFCIIRNYNNVYSCAEVVPSGGECRLLSANILLFCETYDIAPRFFAACVFLLKEFYSCNEYHYHTFL